MCELFFDPEKHITPRQQLDYLSPAALNGFLINSLLISPSFALLLIVD